MGVPGPRGPARRAAALTRLLVPWRWTVAAWSGGYTVTGPTGALAPAGSVDEVVERARAARPGVLGRGCDAVSTDDLDLADALVRASVATLGGDGVVLAGPDPGGPRRLLAHGHVPVEVVPRDGAGWSVSGASVPFGA
ncbi:hypothetical protein ACR9E3_00575 [Actinomycetospora sp. C-140]